MQTADKLDDRFDRITIFMARPRFIHDIVALVIQLFRMFRSSQRAHALRARSLIEYLLCTYAYAYTFESKRSSRIAQSGLQFLGCNLFPSRRWDIRPDRSFFDRESTTTELSSIFIFGMNHLTRLDVSSR